MTLSCIATRKMIITSPICKDISVPVGTELTLNEAFYDCDEGVYCGKVTVINSKNTNAIGYTGFIDLSLDNLEILGMEAIY